MKKEFDKEIIETFGILSESESGWTKEVNLVSWNGGDAMLDIRGWNEDHSRCQKGIRLSSDEAAQLHTILGRILEGAE